MHRLLAALVLALLLATASAAHARGGGGEARANGVCGRGASAELRLKGDDGAIRVELRIKGRSRGDRWRVALVHERRVSWRGTIRAGGGGEARLRRTLPDYAGADEISALATGPRGLSCRATATLGG
ncbi:hypothetical protein Q5424_07155 [Conexibacter sp. JD483]|uniref:hypothetical protein n=1 Tax=unclassified Conexibacter TaxID=2627773 RepID=UPI002722463E|nr:MULTISPECIES: hypothetical protein [unclassified Conexibacter]MDO8186973.1 hypothetical protein [Conexibacter sp. CPCC 205706]MDO8200572.1 hypothetical protein [Conexibacter sp. CPCC 205762]MDR9368850.1 hypothetical protein [Conexibacter sp. JD483]